MPVIVIGADTAVGAEITNGLVPRDGEVRAFVTDPEAARALRDLGVKVAVGDVSDGSHVGGAALNCFCAILIADATSDDRERAFTTTADEVASAWAEGIDDAAVSRVVWAGDRPIPKAFLSAGREQASVPTTGQTSADIVDRVLRLEDAARVPEAG
jgi:putative NADH-flavin reductase